MKLDAVKRFLEAHGSYDGALAQCDAQEAKIVAALDLVRTSIDAAQVLPWPIRAVLRWRGRRVRRKGERALLEVRQARDMLIRNEEVMRHAIRMAQGPWAGRAGR